MHAIERLRHVARAGEVDPTALAIEAADALTGLARDPRAMLLACRRLLEFHPTAGPLWWACAHAVAAQDARAALARCVDELLDDATADWLCGLPSTGDVVCAAATPLVVSAFSDRPDIALRLVGAPYVLGRAVRRVQGNAHVSAHAVHEPADVHAALDGAGICVVEALAASASGVLLDATGRAIADGAARHGIPLAVCAGTGRIVPAPLFEAMCAAAQSAKIEAPGASVLQAADVARLVTDRGEQPLAAAFSANPAVSHHPCPVPEELVSPRGPARPAR